MKLALVVLGGSQKGAEVAVKGPKFLIGRDKDCHLRPKSDLISRHHCVLMIEPNYVSVPDFNSKNGTFVNGDQIVGEQQLKSGDQLVVGPLRFGIKLDVAVAGKKRSKVKNVKEAATRTAQLARKESEEDISDWLDDLSSLDGSDLLSNNNSYRRLDANLR